jgi:RNA recognition motif-containing protein
VQKNPSYLLSYSLFDETYSAKNLAIMSTQVMHSSSDMKGEESGHPSWLVSLYQSVFHFFLGLLNIFQELFKHGDKESMPNAEEEVGDSIVSGSGRVAPAGELDDTLQNVKETNTSDTTAKPDHTVVDLPSVESNGSTALTEKLQDTVQQTETPAFAYPSAYTPVEPSVDQSKNTLVIKNLPFKYKPVDLEALLAEHNTKPKNVRLLRDDAGRFSGMAFIRCVSKEEAQRLIFNMNELDIGGRNIQVEFKMKKKKKGGNSLRTSSEDASSSSLNSSYDELPAVNRLRVSADNVISDKAPMPAPAQIQPAQQDTTRPSGPRKLAVSAEHNFNSDKFRKPPQMRRKSTSAVLDSAPAYAHSALSRIHPALAQASALPSVRPIRQPLGPDGKTNGFSMEYRKLRGQQ